MFAIESSFAIMSEKEIQLKNKRPWKFIFKYISTQMTNIYANCRARKINYAHFKSINQKFKRFLFCCCCPILAAVCIWIIIKLPLSKKKQQQQATTRWNLQLKNGTGCLNNCSMLYFECTHSIKNELILKL